ncbi:hypothetical protein [Imhoffiella purpurea]|uniref:Uncharacterized protein n=1 Tax=Imhoffiella purpurea TaxID=1249627 RepID=W9VC23_9GAMM|nr:hypothetical protein [Imhoffiella purpurea]EXJ13587.1 hypothetical protein D779_3590 [Imhoffiella purpurea]
MARAVVRRGLPLVALPVAGASLPELPGQWRPAGGALAGLGAYQLH